MSNERLGIYNLAFALIAKVQVFPDALNRVLVPASMTNRDSDSRFQMVRISVTGLLVFSLLVVPVLGFWSKPIITLLFGIEYVDSGPIAFILFVGFAFKIIGKPLEAHFNEVVGRPTLVAGIQFFSMTMMIALTYFGAVSHGLIGAAIGSATAIALGGFALFLAYARSSGRSLLSPINFASLLGRVRQIAARIR